MEQSIDPKEFVRKLGDYKDEAPEIFGIPTSTRLDQLFYKLVRKNGEWTKEPLGGIPFRSVINITGEPDTGKSVFAEQFAVFQAGRKYGVCFVTVESPAPFLFTALQ